MTSWPHSDTDRHRDRHFAKRMSAAAGGRQGQMSRGGLWRSGAARYLAKVVVRRLTWTRDESASRPLNAVGVRCRVSGSRDTLAAETANDVDETVPIGSCSACGDPALNPLVGRPRCGPAMVRPTIPGGSLQRGIIPPRADCAGRSLCLHGDRCRRAAGAVMWLITRGDPDHPDSTPHVHRSDPWRPLPQLAQTAFDERFDSRPDPLGPR